MPSGDEVRASGGLTEERGGKGGREGGGVDEGADEWRMDVGVGVGVGVGVRVRACGMRGGAA